MSDAVSGAGIALILVGAGIPNGKSSRKSEAEPVLRQRPVGDDVVNIAEITRPRKRRFSEFRVVRNEDHAVCVLRDELLESRRIVVRVGDPVFHAQRAAGYERRYRRAC